MYKFCRLSIEEVIDQEKDSAEFGDKKVEAERKEGQIQVAVKPRVTDYDLKNDRTSIYRKLDSYLYLIIRNNTNDGWHFPAKNFYEDCISCGKGSVFDANNEVTFSLRNTVENIFNELFISHTYTYSNCPSVVIVLDKKETQQKFSTELEENLELLNSEKLFLYRSVYDNCNSNFDITKTKYSEYAWVDKDELKDYIDDNIYRTIYDVIN
jgi:hypothetical protein